MSVNQLMTSGPSILFDDASFVIRYKKSDEVFVDVLMT